MKMLNVKVRLCPNQIRFNFHTKLFIKVQTMKEDILKIKSCCNIYFHFISQMLILTCVMELYYWWYLLSCHYSCFCIRIGWWGHSLFQNVPNTAPYVIMGQSVMSVLRATSWVRMENAYVSTHHHSGSISTLYKIQQNEQTYQQTNKNQPTNKTNKQTNGQPNNILG